MDKLKAKNYYTKLKIKKKSHGMCEAHVMMLVYINVI